MRLPLFPSDTSKPREVGVLLVPQKERFLKGIAVVVQPIRKRRQMAQFVLSSGSSLAR